MFRAEPVDRGGTVVMGMLRSAMVRGGATDRGRTVDRRWVTDGVMARNKIIVGGKVMVRVIDLCDVCGQGTVMISVGPWSGSHCRGYDQCQRWDHVQSPGGVQGCHNGGHGYSQRLSQGELTGSGP